MKLYSVDKTVKNANMLKKIGYKRATCMALALILAYSMSSFNTKKKEKDSHVVSDIPIFISMAQAKDYLKVEPKFDNDDKVLVTYIESIDNEIVDEVEDNNTLEISDETVKTLEIDNDNTQEITVDNMDFFTKEEIIAYICQKYNLTDFEFKVIASTVYHETFANNYDDVYRVINTIYNRTKSKNFVNYVSYCTGLDGKSMYTQVIAPGQFDGCISGVAGYDYETLLNTVIYDGTKPFETTLDAIFNFLLSEKSIHNFLSFKGLGWNVNTGEPGCGITNWVKYTDLGNTYHDPLTQDDLIDENYELAPYEDSVKVLKKK